MAEHEASGVDPWEVAEDRCAVCGILLGIGIRALHLGFCEKHAAARVVEQALKRFEQKKK